MICAQRCAFSGASSVGFNTIVQPAAMAGRTLQAIWFTGQFHGVIKPQTPSGSRRNSVEPSRLSNSYADSTPIIVPRCPSGAIACAALESHSGAPISTEIVSAISSRCAW